MQVDESPAILEVRGRPWINGEAGGRARQPALAASPAIGLEVLAACCTLAVLCLGQVWFGFSTLRASDLFFFEGPPTVRQLAALFCDTALLAAIFAGIWRVSMMAGGTPWVSRLRNLIFLLFLAVPGNAVRLYFQPAARHFDMLYWRRLGLQGFPAMLKVAAVAGILVLATAFYRFHRVVARGICRSLIFFFPFVPLVMAEAVWVVARPPSHAQLLTNTSTSPGGISIPAGHRRQRVVWIIFDEMDYRLAFESGTKLKLPEFARLAEQSLFAESAFPPGGRTMISIPALLAGRLVVHSRAVGRSELLVQYEGDAKPVTWSAQQTIFDGESLRAGVAGWYFPYGRVFGDLLSEGNARQFLGHRLSLDPHRSLFGMMGDEARTAAEGKDQSLFGQSLRVIEQKNITQSSVAEAIRMADDPALDLVFLHLPIPHAPYFYDARTGGDAKPRRPILGYWDHLQLADRVLGEIRSAMTKSGTGATTSLLVSSDHWNRTADLIDGKMGHRVPFLVNFPALERSPTRAVRYYAPFNTLLSRAMVAAIMAGDIHSPSDAAAWIDQHRAALRESPYNGN